MSKMMVEERDDFEPKCPHCDKKIHGLIARPSRPCR